jgi:hypothetical protein
MRSAAYEAAFGTLYALSEPGSDPADDVSTLYEELLMAEPSGTGGRPGSAGVGAEWEKRASTKLDTGVARLGKGWASPTVRV